MGLFNKKKRNLDEVEEEKIRFFSQSEIEYSIPESRKPIVVKKENTNKKKNGTTGTPKKTNKKTEAKNEAPKPVELKKPAKEKAVKKAAEKKVNEKKTVTKKTVEKKPKLEEKVDTRSPRNGSFDIKKSKDGRFVFNLYSSNRVLIATSQVYSSSQSALAGAKSVMANALRAEIEDTTLKNPSPKTYPKWEIYLDRAGEYRFRLNASNASCICHAKAGYSSKSSCKRAIDSIIRIAQDAEIDKTYIGDKK